MTNIKYSFIITSIAGLSTMLGSILIFFKYRNTDKVVCSALSFAAGVMLTVSATDLIPSSITGLLNIYYLFPALLIALISIVFGIAISTLINKYIPDINSEKVGNKGLFKVGIISMIAIILHNVPEGIATFMTSTKDIQLGLSLALAITLHNIPEGISISVPIYYSTKSKAKAFVSGISEPLGAIIAYLFLAPYMNDLIMSILLSGIAGIMIAISIYELIPASLKYNNTKRTTLYFLIGSIFMMICHLFV